MVLIDGFSSRFPRYIPWKRGTLTVKQQPTIINQPSNMNNHCDSSDTSKGDNILVYDVELSSSYSGESTPDIPSVTANPVARSQSNTTKMSLETATVLSTESVGTVCSGSINHDFCSVVRPTEVREVEGNSESRKEREETRLSILMGVLGCGFLLG